MGYIRCNSCIEKKPTYLRVSSFNIGGKSYGTRSWTMDADGYAALFAANNYPLEAGSTYVKLNGNGIHYDSHDPSITIHNASWDTKRGIIIKVKKGDVLTWYYGYNSSWVCGGELMLIYTDNPITDVYMASPYGTIGNGGYVGSSFTLSDFNTALLIGITYKSGTNDLIKINNVEVTDTIAHKGANGLLLDNPDYISIGFGGGTDSCYTIINKNDVVLVSSYTSNAQYWESSGAALAIKLT